MKTHLLEPTTVAIKINRLQKLALNIIPVMLLGLISPFIIAQASTDSTATSQNILPETTTSLSASLKNDAVLLKWQTTSEQKVEEFVIQYNSNGTAWNNISTSQASGNSSTLQNYSFIHTGIAKGINNYRLLQRDAEGRISYSKIVSVLNFSESRQLIVYSNPANSGSIILQLQQPNTVSLYNMNGVLVLQKNLPSGMQELDINMLSKGMYQLKAGEEVTKIMLQ